MAHCSDGGLGGGVVLLGGFAKPFQRLVVVAVDSAVVGKVKHSDSGLSGGVSLSGGEQVPFCGFRHVALESADAALVKGAEGGLGFAVSAPCGALVPSDGFFGVGAHLLADAIGLRQRKLRLGVAGFRALCQGGDVLLWHG